MILDAEEGDVVIAEHAKSVGFGRHVYKILALLDTKELKQVSSNNDNFLLKSVIYLWEVWIGWTKYYLYVYEKKS